MAEEGIVTCARLEQPENSELPTDVTEPGSAIVTRLEQSWKAELPMELTESGIVIETRPEQFLNALLPIDATDTGITTLLRLEHPEKASDEIEVTLSPRVMLHTPPYVGKVLLNCETQ